MTLQSSQRRQPNFDYPLSSPEARLILSLPIREGGFGLRSTERSSPPAYWSALAQAAPELLLFANKMKTSSDASSQPPPSLLDSSRPFVNALSDCHKFMVQNGVVPLKDDLLPLNYKGYWQFYGTKSPGRGLQRLLSSTIESSMAASLLTKADKDFRTKARLRSTRGKGAGAWLTTLPVTPALTLSDAHFRVACRLRLGLPPHDHLPRYCSCGYSLEGDPTHFLSCKKLKRSAITQRHNMVLQRLSGLLQKAGGSVRIEPNWYDGKRPDALVLLTKASYWT